MQKLSQPRAIVVGAGILGLAYARSLSLRGYSTDVFERSEKASGSSIRNFGMVWPIGQPHGRMLNRAMKSREIWVDLCKSAKIWAKQTGSLQLLSNELEFEMGKEFLERESTHRPKLHLLDKQQTKAIFPLAHKNNRGAIYSGTEVIVEAREAIRLIPAYLEAQHGVKFHFNTPVVEIANGFICTAKKHRFEADIIILCSGYETNLLYPEVYESAPITISQPEHVKKPSVIAHDSGNLCWIEFFALWQLRQTTLFGYLQKMGYRKLSKTGVPWYTPFG